MCEIDYVDIEETNKTILAACIIHNACLLNDPEQDFIDDHQIDQINKIPAGQPNFAPHDIERQIIRLFITNNLNGQIKKNTNQRK